jgi:hypothetical protein
MDGRTKIIEFRIELYSFCILRAALLSLGPLLQWGPLFVKSSRMTKSTKAESYFRIMRGHHSDEAVTEPKLSGGLRAARAPRFSTSP